MSCRMRWVEALEILPEGPLRELVQVAGDVLNSGNTANLGPALDAVVDEVIERNPVDAMMP